LLRCARLRAWVVMVRASSCPGLPATGGASVWSAGAARATPAQGRLGMPSKWLDRRHKSVQKAIEIPADTLEVPMLSISAASETLISDSDFSRARPLGLPK